MFYFFIFSVFIFTLCKQDWKCFQSLYAAEIWSQPWLLNGCLCVTTSYITDALISFSEKGYKEGKKGFCLASLAFILVVRVYVKDITLVYVSHKKDVKNEWNFFSYIPSSLCYIGVIKLWSFFFWCSTISFMLIRCELNKIYFFP